MLFLCTFSPTNIIRAHGEKLQNVDEQPSMHCLPSTHPPKTWGGQKVKPRTKWDFKFRRKKSEYQIFSENTISATYGSVPKNLGASAVTFFTSHMLPLYCMSIRGFPRTGIQYAYKKTVDVDDTIKQHTTLKCLCSAVCINNTCFFYDSFKYI